MKDWTQSDLRRLFDESLNAFAWEFYSVHEFRQLSRAEKIRVLRAVKSDIAARFTYEWMMRSA